MTLPHSIETVVRYEALGRIKPLLIGRDNRYGAEAHLRLQVILKARRLGFSSMEIKRLMDTTQEEAQRASADKDETGLD